MRLDAGRHSPRDRQHWMVLTFAYMLALAYLAAFATYRIASAFGLA